MWSNRCAGSYLWSGPFIGLKRVGGSFRSWLLRVWKSAPRRWHEGSMFLIPQMFSIERVAEKQAFRHF